MSKNLSIKLHTMEHHIQSYFLRIWEKILAGKGWTLVFLLWVGLLIASFLYFTVYFRPIEQIVKPSRRVHHLITLWIDHGFFKHGGLNFSESPEVNPQALVYKSYPPAFLYPLYLGNLLNYWMRGVKFDLQLYVLYNQVFLWISAASLGFLGVRVAKRLGTSPLLALTCGIIGQMIYHTLPYNLEKYFEPTTQQFSCLFLIWFFIIEEFNVENTQPKFLLIQGLSVLLMVYLNKPAAIPGLSMYFLSKILMGYQHSKNFGRLSLSVFMGLFLHFLQLVWVRLSYQEVSFVGAPFIWRSGLDGATNRVGVLTPDQLGAGNVFLRNVGVLSLIIILWFFFRSSQHILKFPLLLVFTAIGFYILPGYFLSQWTIIHPYNHDMFLIIASILVSCYTLIPYLESKTGNTGIITLIMVVVGFCLSMYQLRIFAIHYPLPIPEPNWRLYRSLI